jgi:hypothetical protein
MVDFKKLREAKAKPKPKNPRDIFNALPKPPGINDLYASQAEVLDAWFAIHPRELFFVFASREQCEAALVYTPGSTASQVMQSLYAQPAAGVVTN